MRLSLTPSQLICVLYRILLLFLPHIFPKYFPLVVGNSGGQTTNKKGARQPFCWKTRKALLKYNFLYYTEPSPRTVVPLAQISVLTPKKLPPHAGTKKTAPYNRAKQLHKIKNSSFAPVTSVKKFVLSPSFASLLDPPESPMNPAKIDKKTKNKTVACLLLLHKISKTTLISFLLKRRSTFPRSRSSFFCAEQSVRKANVIFCPPLFFAVCTSR